MIDDYDIIIDFLKIIWRMDSKSNRLDVAIVMMSDAQHEAWSQQEHAESIRDAWG